MKPKLVITAYKVNTQNYTMLRTDSTNRAKVDISNPNEDGCKKLLLHVRQWLESYKAVIGLPNMGDVGYALRIESASGTIDVTMYSDDKNGNMEKLAEIYELSETEFKSAYKGE